MAEIIDNPVNIFDLISKAYPHAESEVYRVPGNYYSPLIGPCRIALASYWSIRIESLPNPNDPYAYPEHEVSLDPYGHYAGAGECMLFPSAEQRDWSAITPDYFTPKAC